jgi:quinoprotein glucose dehydrogenase
MPLKAFRHALMLLLLGGASTWVGIGLAGQTPARPADAAAGQSEWPTYGADLANTKYRALDQITAANFEKLELAWRFRTDNLGPRPEVRLEATPLMVKGVLYTTAGTRRSVVAIDAATGEQLWSHREDEGERGVWAPRQWSGRGVAYWTDGKEERILYTTPGYRLIALDARTGHVVSSFGRNGVVDLKLDDDQTIDLVRGEIGIQSAPVIAKDVIVIGASFREGMTPRSARAYKGHVRGYDVRTGKRLWIFHTIPQKGEFGYDTWLDGSAEYTGNTGVWTQMAIDEQLGLAYLPVESPTGDIYGGHRPGNNLFAESLVCVDVKTGQRKWHFQLVHHPLWDHDLSSAPILADITVNGKPIKAVALPSKQAFLYVFDRVTGQPVWPIEERAVPKGDVPGEWYAPTQPFPTRPPAYDRQGASKDELIDFTPELRAQAEKIAARYTFGPLYTPPVVSKPGGSLGTLTLAGALGGTNWPGGAYDPESHTVFASTSTTLIFMGLIPPPSKEFSDMNYVLGNAEVGTRYQAGAGEIPGPHAPPPLPAGYGNGVGIGGPFLDGGLPIMRPPYGQIAAINLDRGEIVWKVPHGETPDNVKNHPALKGIAIPKTGKTGSVGTLVTKTLLIAGESGFSTKPNGERGAWLWAYDKTTGKDVGRVWMPGPQGGAPMTYLLNGRQYVVVAVSSPAAEFLAFALPAAARQTSTGGNGQ